MVSTGGRGQQLVSTGGRGLQWCPLGGGVSSGVHWGEGSAVVSTGGGVSSGVHWGRWWCPLGGGVSSGVHWGEGSAVVSTGGRGQQWCPLGEGLTVVSIEGLDKKLCTNGNRIILFQLLMKMIVFLYESAYPHSHTLVEGVFWWQIHTFTFCTFFK